MKLTVKQINIIIDSLKDEAIEDEDNEKEIDALIERFENYQVDLSSQQFGCITGFDKNIYTIDSDNIALCKNS